LRQEQQLWREHQAGNCGSHGLFEKDEQRQGRRLPAKE
jgi:hypothetical protein